MDLHILHDLLLRASQPSSSPPVLRLGDVFGVPAISEVNSIGYISMPLVFGSVAGAWSSVSSVSSGLQYLLTPMVPPVYGPLGVCDSHVLASPVSGLDVANISSVAGAGSCASVAVESLGSGCASGSCCVCRGSTSRLAVSSVKLPIFEPGISGACCSHRGVAHVLSGMSCASVSSVPGGSPPGVLCSPAGSVHGFIDPDYVRDPRPADMSLDCRLDADVHRRGVSGDASRRHLHRDASFVRDDDHMFGHRSRYWHNGGYARRSSRQHSYGRDRYHHGQGQYDGHEGHGGSYRSGRSRPSIPRSDRSGSSVRKPAHSGSVNHHQCGRRVSFARNPVCYAEESVGVPVSLPASAIGALVAESEEDWDAAVESSCHVAAVADVVGHLSVPPDVSHAGEFSSGFL